MGIWRIVAKRPAEMDCSELYYGGPKYKAGYTPISEDLCYAFLLEENLDRSFVGEGPNGALLKERGQGYGGIWGEVRDSLADDAVVNYQWIEAICVESPWHRGRSIIIGDAAHACPPLIAQGAAMCAEDAVVLAEMLTSGDEVDDVLPAFMERRFPRVKMVLDNSLTARRVGDPPGHRGRRPRPDHGPDPARPGRAGLMALRCVGLAGEDGFEEARVDRIFNRRLTDRQPAAVVRPQTEAEVVAACGWRASAAGRSPSAPAGTAGRSGRCATTRWSSTSAASGRSSYDDGTGIVSAGPAVKGGAELAPYLDDARPVLPRRPLPDRRHRRLPAPGRPGLERARLGLGGGVRRGGRRGHRRRRAGPRGRRPERRPLLGRARRRARASSGSSPASTCARSPAPRSRRPDRAGLPPRRLRRGDDLAARHPPRRSPTPSRSWR